MPKVQHHSVIIMIMSMNPSQVRELGITSETHTPLHNQEKNSHDCPVAMKKVHWEEGSLD